MIDAHTTAVVACLTAASLRAGDGDRPAGAGWQGGEGSSDFLAYCIVYPPPILLDGPSARRNDDLRGDWQVTSISRDRHGADVVADHVRAALIDGAVVVASRYVWPVKHAGGSGARRDNSTKPPLFYAVDRFTIRTTPA